MSMKDYKNVTNQSRNSYSLFKVLKPRLNMLRILFLFLFCFLNYPLFSQNLTYIYPLPNTNMHSLKTPIILRFDREINCGNIFSKFKIVGEKSGEHSFDINLSNDKRTISIKVHRLFATDEEVLIEFTGEKYTFRTSKITPFEQKKIFVKYFSDSFPEITKALLGFNQVEKTISEDILQDSIPADFPKIIIDSVRNPAPGYIYLANFGSGVDRSYLMILDNDGKPVKYKKVPLPGFDFKMQPNGLLSNGHIITSHIPQGWGWAEAYMEVMDPDLQIIDTIQCQGGYIADFHDFKMLPNGHYLLISYDPQPVDMSQIIPEGNPNAIVLGSIVQELDADKNVVFQWRSWDHIPITDSYAPLSGVAVDPIHINAVELDYDGHLLISSRHLSEITKISRETGEIIWRLGGKKNQFKFINEHPENEPTYFSYQHDIRRLPNGNITLYDNGNQHNPPYSRAVEYKLDEQNLTAELVWEYRNNPDIFGETMGSTQRLPNGNTVIGWGGVNSGHIRIVTEVNPAGEIEFELSFPKGVSFQTTSYRAYRFPYPTIVPEAVVSFENVSQLIPDSILDFQNDNINTGVFAIFEELTDEDGSKITLEKYPNAPLYPRFVGTTPLVNQYKVIIKTEKITKSKVLLGFDLNKFPLCLHRKNLIVFRRMSPDEPFEPLESIYDTLGNLLFASVETLDGEYIFGTQNFGSMPLKPILTYPANNSVLNTDEAVVCQWTPRGNVNYSQLLFKKIDGTFPAEATYDVLKTNILNLGKLPVGKYSWKVRAVNNYGTSEWSDEYTFEVKEPFVTIISPVSGDKWLKERDVKIEWKHNIYPAFEITLFKGNAPIMNISDSIYSAFGKYIWNVSNLLPVGDDYKVRITSLKNKNIYAESQTFSISEPSSVFEQTSSILIYPNPSSGKIIVQNRKEEVIKIEIFSIMGLRELEINQFRSLAFNQEVDLTNLPNGLYYFVLHTNRSIYRLPLIIFKN